MRSGRVLISAIVCLVAGIWVLFENCQGNVGVTFGDSLTANKLSMDATTVGVPMLIGLPLVGLGTLLTLIAFIGAIVMQFRKTPQIEREDESPRRDLPFEE